jgi:integrase
MVLHNAIEFACEIGLLAKNPLQHVKWTRPRKASGVDPRVVINAEQAQRFLTAVEADGQRGPRLKALFACMYYAAQAGRSHRTPPIEPDPSRQVRRVGEMRISDARPRSGSRWTNTGEIREQVPLKHWAEGEARRVPIHPDLARILKTHLDQYGPDSPHGRLFVGVYGGPVTDRTYLRIFHRARAAAFTSEEAASPLMEVPYALPQAAVSTWLPTTGDPPLVARWAGHSVAVLLKVYAKCVDGTEQQSLDRIWAATRREGETTSPGNE